jgi:uncharacterized protein (DUF302 family)
MDKTNYGFSVELPVDFDTALATVTDKLKDEGFGVLTEIDVRETLKKKLDVDFRQYRILGACNPPLAHKALSAEDDIGLLLPCNVIVYELDNGQTKVAAIDPVVAMEVTGNEKIRPIANQVRQKLESVLKALSSESG